MPELPEVETVRRGLEPVMLGARIGRLELRRPDLRFPFPKHFAEAVAGRKIISVGRRAKYLLLDLEDGQVVIMHLGMSGRFLIGAKNPAEPGSFYYNGTRLPAHDHVIFHLEAEDGARQVIYNDVRRFGFMDLTSRKEMEMNKHLCGLGAEPDGNALTPDLLANAFAGKAAPLKAALLDQHVVAGLGNIYVCEALHMAGLSPRRAAGTLVTKAGAPSIRLERLTDAIRTVIANAIAAGGSSLRDYVHADGSLGYFQHAFNVYDRAGSPCPKEGCGGTIRRIVQSGRSTFYCPSCQK